MAWSEIFKDVTIVGILAGLLTWLIKQLGQTAIDKNLKNYELELSNKSDLFKQELNFSFEKHKTDLNLLAEKANKLHDKRLERIENIYELLTDFHDDMQNLIAWQVTTGMSESEITENELKRVQCAGDSGNKFMKFYSRNKLYFNEETCKLIDEILSLLRTSHSEYSFKYIFGKMSAEIEFENAKKASETVRDKVPIVKAKLEENFRSIIGVE